MKKIIALSCLLFTAYLANAQNPTVLITDADYANGNECDCQNAFTNGSLAHFFDSGGAGGNYADNEDETIVFCPDLNTGTKVSVAFGINAGFSWNVDGTDSVYIYDGDNIGAPLLGVHNSVTDPNGFTHQASWNNPTGCITVRFVSDGSVNAGGWAANVTCGNVPQPFSPNITGYINGGGFPGAGDITPADTGYVDVCFGDSILFIGSGTFPNSFETTGYGYSQNDNNCTYEWEFSDGTQFTGDSVWFLPPNRAGYLVTMTMTDPVGWIQQIKCKVRVSTIPSFAGTIAIPDTICLGQSSNLQGGVTNTDTVGVDPTQGGFEVGGVFAGLTYLPDGSGQNYQTSITITDFTPGQLVTQGSDVQGMCVTMEHSYMGDLEMILECPNGQTATIFNVYGGAGEIVPGGFGGGGTYIGDAYDNNIGNPGTGWEYCFEENAVWGDFPTEWTANNFTAVTNTIPGTQSPNWSNGNSMAAGTYKPEETYDNFIGCPINGDWTITIRDNLSIDDGYIFEWGIFFDPAINPNTEFYTPTISSEVWLNDPTIVLDGDTNLIVTPNTTGDFNYTFFVTDNFGCSYDTTITVHVLELPTVISDPFACDMSYAFNGNNAPNGGSWSYSSNAGVATFVPDSNAVDPVINVTADGIYDFTFTDAVCNLDTTVQIIFVPSPAITLGDTTVCDGATVTLDAGNEGIGASYSWDPGGQVTQTLSATTTNTYTVTVTNQCGVAIDDAVLIFEVCDIIIPNVFSPNTDGYNDNFVIFGLDKKPNSRLEIYNRWGKLIFEDPDYSNDWDGKVNGNPVSDGTYYFILTTGDEEVHKGTITVVTGR